MVPNPCLLNFLLVLEILYVVMFTFPLDYPGWNMTISLSDVLDDVLRADSDANVIVVMLFYGGDFNDFSTVF